MRGEQIGKDTVQHDHQAGIKRKVLSDIPESDVNRNCIEQKIDNRERQG